MVIIMKRLWGVIAVVAAMVGLVGCGALGGKQPQQTQGAGQLTPSPTSFSFGNVQAGNSSSQSGSVSNTGQASLSVTQITVSGVGFSINGIAQALTLGVGQSANFNVVFAPTNPGVESGTISFSTSNGTVVVPLSGTGVGAGVLTANPSSYDFGNVLIGDATSEMETLKNTGGENVTVTAATPPNSAFSYAGLSLPLTLGPNQSSTFSISFAPTAAGSSGGNFVLTVSGSSAVDIAVSGTGVTPATLTANPTSLTFTNVQVGQSSSQTETVKNTGGSNAQISQVTASGTGFSVSGIQPPVTLTPGQSVSFSVTFTPQSAGTFSGNVVVSSDAQNPSLTVPLTGTAVGAQGTLGVTSPINVGNVVVGLSGTQTGTLTASGASVVVSSVTMGGTNPSDFSISGLSFPVTVTTSQPVSFTVTFTPAAVGSASATASFASNASNSPSVATLTGTGTAAPVHNVQLTWVASVSGGITSYNVYRAIYGGSTCGSYGNIGSTSGSVTTYTDSSVTDGTTYCYAATAVDPEGESGYSNIVQAQIPPP